MSEEKKRNRPTLEQVQKALTDANGNLTAAAKKLGVTRQCLYGWVKKRPELQDLRAEAGETLLDTAEDKIRRAVEQGEPWAIRFVLARKGRSRGWGNSLDIHTDPAHGKVVIVRLPDNGRDVDPAQAAAAVDEQLKGHDGPAFIIPDNGRLRE